MKRTIHNIINHQYDPPEYDPYRRIWHAVLIRALRDYLDEPNDMKEDDYNSAVRFIYSPFGAELIEDATDIPMLKARRFLAKIKEKNVNQTEASANYDSDLTKAE